jgi:UDP:flavonoid glycosyltransferase YjiC (YdhE family)
LAELRGIRSGGLLLHRPYVGLGRSEWRARCVASLKYAVPSVIVPTHNEREYNARLMANLGCAEFVPKSEVTGERIDAAIHRVLETPSVRQRLGFFAEIIAERYSNSAERAASVIASLSP